MLTGSLVGVLVPGTSSAQEVPGVAPVSLGQLLDPNITTASRILERATEAPATVYVVTGGDIRARGYSTLADVLRDLPGMEVIEQYYSEQGTLVPVRGVVGNNKIVLLVNGMRVNPPGGEELMIAATPASGSPTRSRSSMAPGRRCTARTPSARSSTSRPAAPATSWSRPWAAMGWIT